MMPKVAVIYLSFHSEPYLDDVAAALEKLTYPKEQVEFIIVDNPHPQYGSSMRYLYDQVMPKSGLTLPKVTILANETNLGFAGGNNVGIHYALENGFDYVFFHNNDAFVAANFLEPLVKTMEEDKTIGAAQSLLLLHPETELINSSGDVMHFLGFGYCWGYRRRLAEAHLPPVKIIGYASGAGLLMRTDLLKQYGLWDEDFFLYHEDLEYCYRLKSVGYKIVLVRDSVVYHKYQFGRSIIKYFWMERNRYGVMLEFFKWPTLLLLLPIGLVMEAALIIFAWKGQWLEQRLEVYRYWLKPANWNLWLKKRRIVQARRTVTDRQLTAEMVSEILFQESAITNPVLKYVGNPVMKVYWRLVRLIMWW